MPVLRSSRDFLRSVAQVFDLTGTLASGRLREMREQARAGGTTRDWERVSRNLDNVVQRYATSHGE